MIPSMRAKMRITDIEKRKGIEGETLKLHAVAKEGPYPSDGSDEDNTFAKFSPDGYTQIQVANPALLNKYKLGDTFYVDFTPVEQKSDRTLEEFIEENVAGGDAEQSDERDYRFEE